MNTRLFRNRTISSRLVATFAVAQLLPWMVYAAEPKADDATQIKVASASAQYRPAPALEIADEEIVESTLEDCRPIRRLGGKIRIQRHSCTN